MSSTNHVALVTSWGSPPAYTAVPVPPVPEPESDLVQIRVLAVGAHQLVRGRAAGRHYTSGPLPHVVGVDGVGTTVPEGKTVYFVTLRTKTGSFAELVNVPKKYVFELHAGEPHAIAAMVNPVMSSWMALTARVDTDKLPKEGWTCVIVGATSASGIIAAALARKRGATRIVGIARSAEKLAAVPDLDSYIALSDPVTETDFSQLGEVDVILDYLYGPIIAHLLSSLPRQDRAMQYVQIGSVAGLTSPIPAVVLRSKDLTLRGAGPGAWNFEDFNRELPDLLAFAAEAPKPKIRVEKLSDIERVWTEPKGEERLVFTV